MIQTKDVNEAYDAFEASFDELAKIEDREQELVADLGEYKEGSRKAEDLNKKIKAIQPKKTDALRKYRKAGIKVDRIRLLLDCEKNAKGTD